MGQMGNVRLIGGEASVAAGCSRAGMGRGRWLLLKPFQLFSGPPSPERAGLSFVCTQ